MPFIISDENAGKIPHNCLVKLQAIYDSLKTAEKKAADLLLNRPEFFAEASVVEAADAAGCSKATLVRLAQKLGYGGYTELKSILLKKKVIHPEYLYEDITEDDDYGAVAKKVFRASIQALEDTLDILDEDDYAKAVDAICNAKKVVLCGVGDAAAVARSGFQKLIRLGMDAQTSEDMDVQLITVSRLTKGDVVIVISYSGRTRSIVDIAKYSKNIGATVICITNYPISPLAKNSDIVLLTAAFTEHAKGEVMSKRITELCILESLFINVLLKQKAVLSDNLERSNIALEINKL